MIYLLFNLDNVSEDFCPLLQCVQEHFVIWLFVIDHLVGCCELALSVWPIFPLEIVKLDLARLEDPLQAVP